MKTRKASRSNRARLARTVALSGSAAALMFACVFDQIYGVSQLSYHVANGMLETNTEGDRVYVGTAYNGDYEDAEAVITSIDPVTGARKRSLHWTSNPVRAIAENTSDDTVWLLRDDGTLDRKTKDLLHISSWSGFFTHPSGTLVRFCDLEQLPNGHFIATGLYKDADGDPFAFWTHVQPDPAAPADWIHDWRSYPVISDPNTSCPRVSYDTSVEELVLLQPYVRYNALPEHRITRFEQFAWDVYGKTYYLFSTVDQWTMPTDMYTMNDITAEHGKVVLARQHLTDSNGGYLEIFDLETGVSDDTVALDKARAVDFAVWAQSPSDASSVLWWGGLEGYTGSDFELGVFGFAE